MLDSVLQMTKEIKRCEEIEAWHACLLQVYAYIDALSFLAMPKARNTNTRSDYIAWVDKYMKARSDQPYQYRGIDFYGARCAVLHQFGSASDFHAKYPDTIKFGYSDGGHHLYDQTIEPKLAILGLHSLVDDFIGAVVNMLEDMRPRVRIEEERLMIQNRLTTILTSIPIVEQPQAGPGFPRGEQNGLR